MPDNLITDFNLTQQSLDEAQVVFQGSGPVGLWTAIQTKLNHWDAKIVMLERNPEYLRKYVLKINPKSLPNLSSVPQVDAIAQKEFSEVYHSFKDLVADFAKRKVIPTKEIESKLKEIALKAGIIIAYDQRKTKNNTGITEPEKLPAYFPNASVFVGADGSRSLVREKVFQDRVERTALHHVVQVKYKIDGEGAALGSLKMVHAKSKLGNMANEHIGHLNEENETPATLQIFIPQASFDKLKDAAKSGNPIHLNQLRDLAPDVASQIQEWFNIKKKRHGEALVENSEEISVIPLEYYSSKSFILKIGNITWILVGDAAFGVPFFRSMNNGLLCGTQLAKAIADALKQRNVEREHLTTKELIFKQAPFEEYQTFVKKQAAWEINIARIKSFFLSAYIFILKIFDFGRLRRRFYEATGWVEGD